MQTTNLSLTYFSPEYRNFLTKISFCFKLLPAVAAVMGCFVSSQVLGQDCSNIANNREWTQNISKLQNYFKAENYDAVIETAKPMFNICADSPSLLFYTGAALEKQGELERALIYYTKASENLTVMASEPGISRQIWYKRYELEHPDRTEEAVSGQKEKIAELEQKVTDLEKQSFIESTNVSLDESKKHERILWTGVGLGIAGVIFIGTGAGVAASVEKSELVSPNGNKLSINKGFTAGWGLLGTGIGMTVAGAIMAGIGGYHYSKAKTDAVMTFNASPMSASFAMTF